MMKKMIRKATIAAVAIATTAGAFAQSSIIRSKIDVNSRVVYNQIPTVAPTVQATPVGATTATGATTYTYSAPAYTAPAPTYSTYSGTAYSAPAAEYNTAHAEAERAAAYAAQTEAAARAAAAEAAKPIDLSEFGVVPFVYQYSQAPEGAPSAMRMSEEARKMLAEIAALRNGGVAPQQQQAAQQQQAPVVAPASSTSKKERKARASAEQTAVAAEQQQAAPQSAASAARTAEIQMREAQATAAQQQLEIYERAAAEQRIAYEKALEEQRMAQTRAAAGIPTTEATATTSTREPREKTERAPREPREPREQKQKSAQQEAEYKSFVALGYQHATEIKANAFSIMYARVNRVVGGYARGAIGTSYNYMDTLTKVTDAETRSAYMSLGGGLMFRVANFLMPYVGVMGVSNKFGYEYTIPSTSGTADLNTTEYSQSPLTRFTVAPEVGINLQFGRINANVGVGYIPGTTTTKYTIPGAMTTNVGIGIGF